jgi:hypothetical protein
VAPLQCLGERDVVGLRLHSGEERKDGQVLEDLGLAQGELLQRVCDLIGHVVPPSQHLEGGTDMNACSSSGELPPPGWPANPRDRTMSAARRRSPPAPPGQKGAEWRRVSPYPHPGSGVFRRADRESISAGWGVAPISELRGIGDTPIRKGDTK